MTKQTDNRICECGHKHIYNTTWGLYGLCEKYKRFKKDKGCPCKKFTPLVYDYKNSDYNRMEEDTPQKQETIRDKKGLLNAFNKIAEEEQEEYNPYLKCGHKRQYLQNGKCWICENTLIKEAMEFTPQKQDTHKEVLK